MQLTKTSIYAVSAILHIAANEEKGFIQGINLGKRCGIPPSYLAKALQQLVRIRILTSEQGRNGGYALAKPPSRITLLEIVEGLEGPVNGDLVLRHKIGLPQRSQKKFHATRKHVLDKARTRLGKVTIKQLMD